MSLHPQCHRREHECGRELKIEIRLPRAGGGMSSEERPFRGNGALKKQYGAGEETIYKQRETSGSQAWWPGSVITRGLRQENQEFKASLGCTVSSRLT